MRAEDNEFLTRVGPGTPMGELMRRYWFPAIKADELAPGGAPVRLRLLGENFIAFRSPDGTVGIVDHECAHRCASLWYGRNEDGGIRCVYHGWKFRHDGQCIDMPSEPPETDYSDRIRLRALATREIYGVVWAFMGERDQAPPFPEFDLGDIPQGELEVSFMFRECNWLQALEGDIDTCHVGFLHGGGSSPDDFKPGTLDYYRTANRNPKYEVVETPYGTMYSAFRPGGPGETYHRVAQFLLPFFTMTPSEPLGHNRLRAWLPVDDGHSMLVVMTAPRRTPYGTDKDGKRFPGLTVDLTYLPNTSDWYGRWRIQENPRNDHLISRDLQQDRNYSGIVGIPVQDQAVTESMGPIVNRTKEHLGTSDRMIMQTRRVLMRAAAALRDHGTPPPGTVDPTVYRGVRAGFLMLPSATDWLDDFNRRRIEWGGEAARPIERGERRGEPEPAAAAG
jgi:phenylpropionate dioxygenase-like ring-hydroxylating dioxygenase large terminal subunit